MLIRFQSRLSFRQKSFEKFIESERQKHLRWNLKNSQIESLLREDNNSTVTEIKLINDEEIYKKVYTFCPVTLQPIEQYFINDKLYRPDRMTAIDQKTFLIPDFLQDTSRQFPW